MKKLPSRVSDRLGLWVFLGVISAAIIAIAVVIVINWSIVSLVFNPENITLTAEHEMFTQLRVLEAEGNIKDVVTDTQGEETKTSYKTADNSISVDTLYKRGTMAEMSGAIDAGSVQVGSIDDAMELARVMLSPYLSKEEINAVLLSSTSKIISHMTESSLDIQLTIAANYDVHITGSQFSSVNFIIKKAEIITATAP